jgi:hypothetical protein
MCTRNYLRLLAALAMLIGAGCSGEEPQGDPSNPSAHSFGLMSVAYTHDWQADGATGLSQQDLELTTTAQFVRYSALERTQVARLLALPLDPDADLPARDACKLYDLTVDLGEEGGLDQSETATVDLLEAGDLTVETSGNKLKLEPRHFPGLLPFISGVAYGEAQSDRAAKSGRVHVSASGGEAVGAFRVDAASPLLPRIHKLAGEGPREPTLRIDQSLSLSWATPTDENRLDEDVLYIEARVPSAKRDLVVRCSPSDDGRFTIGASELAKLASKAGQRLVVELIRLRRTYFAARGLDSGELRISVRDRTSLKLR